jgi:hypothetical protein
MAALQLTPRQRALLAGPRTIRIRRAREFARQALVDEGVLPGQRQATVTKKPASR